MVQLLCSTYLIHKGQHCKICNNKKNSIYLYAWRLSKTLPSFSFRRSLIKFTYTFRQYCCQIYIRDLSFKKACVLRQMEYCIDLIKECVIWRRRRRNQKMNNGRGELRGIGNGVRSACRRGYSNGTHRGGMLLTGCHWRIGQHSLCCGLCLAVLLNFSCTNLAFISFHILVTLTQTNRFGMCAKYSPLWWNINNQLQLSMSVIRERPQDVRMLPSWYFPHQSLGIQH